MLGFTLGGVHSADLDKCGVACIQHYGFIVSIFTAKIPFHQFIPPHAIPAHPPPPLATTGLFIVSIVLPFTECHTVGITQYVGFSDQPF